MTGVKMLDLETIGGPKEVPAPDGYDYDKTATIAWARLLDLTREMHGQRMHRQSQKYFHRVDAKMEILAVVLASSLGMAAPYWYQRAREILESHK